MKKQTKNGNGFRVGFQSSTLPVFQSSSLLALLAAGLLAGTARAWTPADISPTIWLDASDSNTVVLNGSTVATWSNKAVNAYHAVQATATNQPTYTPSALNGQAVLTFNGTNYMTLGAIPLVTSNTLFAVAKAAVTNGTVQTVFGNRSTNDVSINPEIDFFNSSVRFLARKDATGNTLANDSSLGVFPNQWTIWGGLRTNNTVTAYTNGVAGTPNTATGTIDPTTANMASLGAYFNNSTTPAGYLTGSIAEVVFFTNALSTANRQLTEGYLAWKWWGASNPLPSSHPYKTVDPRISGILPAIQNLAATNITTTSADLRGSLSSTGSSDTAVSVYWGPSDGGTNGGPTYWAYTNSFGSGLTNGTYVTNTSYGTTFTKGTKCYYNFYASNTAGGVWAATALPSPSFTTLTNPVVTVSNATVGVGTATLNGLLTSDGGAATTVYFCWGAGASEYGTSTSAWPNVVLYGTATSGQSVSTNLTGLTYGLTYWYRVYATNSAGDAWSAATNFLTAAAPGWPSLLATGGDQYYVTNVDTKAYGVHIFTTVGSGGTFTPNPGVTHQVEYLVVAGGGGGGRGASGDPAGGGGAGGLLTNAPSSWLTISNAQTITVGIGGTGATSTGQGVQGGQSKIGTLIVANGGCGGLGSSANSQTTIGSGGGGAAVASPSGSTNGVTGGQGNKGGNAYRASYEASRYGGGGGGAGGAGVDFTGGAGVTYSIIGAPVVYATGGGGDGDGPPYAYGTPGSGGSGGICGGNGDGNNAYNNTGGGGGGKEDGNGGNGGSGIVVIRYEIPHPAGFPDIENLPATNVTTTSATFNGRLISNGASSATVCVLWGETNGGNSWTSWANTNWWNPGEWADGESKGVTISPLTPNKTFYYTFAATNATGRYIAAWPASPPQVFITGDVTVKVTTATAQYPTTDGQFQIMRPNTGTCTNLPLTIYYTLGGDAINGTDYINTNGGSALPSSVTLGAGVTSATITVKARANFNAARTVVLTLSPSNYPCGSPAYSGTITINPAPALGRLLAWGGDQSYTTNLNGKLYGVHKYTTTGPRDFTATKTLYCDYLVVAGGGGGGGKLNPGNGGGGGGGAGGLLTNSSTSLLALGQGLTWITVGSGGAGATSFVQGGKGGNSSISTSVVAKGGCGGLGPNVANSQTDIGSGGGGSASGGDALGGVTGGQGNKGGDGYASGYAGTKTGGGGGGAGGKGGNGASDAAGNGGNGVTNSITDTPVVYATGGGGSYNGVGGSGGVHGNNGGTSGGNASNGTGSGGGGASSGTGGNGGTGIVVIRYEILPKGTVFMFR